MGKKMSGEVREMICRMDAGKIENQIVLQCAPLIVGLRMSSLFIIGRENLKRIHSLLWESGICYYVLYVTEARAVILLYRSHILSDYLDREEVREFFAKMDYTPAGMKNILPVFRSRYRAYCKGDREFPHELGLILGYPIEDVKGFILHKGKNPLYAGYWKVYSDAAGKCELFRMFELAREMLVELLENGAGIRDIIEEYQGNEWVG
ncbi:MAG: DUF3793 family protein [Eubacterium sp.]|nr:DUF3793 family protein [Eubacterium sp.]